MTVGLDELLWCAAAAECLARKPGNVHPGAAFDDVSVREFLASAEAAAPCLAAAASIGVGAAIERAVAQTRRRVSTNTNLGICLLLGPCAAADPAPPFPDAVTGVLGRLTRDDAAAVFRAIRHAAPAGLGNASDHDVHSEPTQDLVSIMRLAADRDLIAAQYAHGFRDVWEIGVAAITEAEAVFGDPESALISAHLQLMAAHPDSLIARKCGHATAQESQRRARDVLAAGGLENVEGRRRLDALDQWLRADGHRRNPGTCADLVCASAFVALRWGLVPAPAWLAWTRAEAHRVTELAGGATLPADAEPL